MGDRLAADTRGRTVAPMARPAHRRPSRLPTIAGRALTAAASLLVVAGSIAALTRASADTTATRPTVITGSEFDSYTAAQSSRDSAQDAKVSDLESRVSALESSPPAPAPSPTPTPTPTSSPTPATDRGPSGSTVVWSDNFDNGLNCSIWTRMQNDDTASGSSACPDVPQYGTPRGSFPAGSGYGGTGRAFRSEVDPGDLSANGERSELSGDGASWIFHDGDDVYLQERIKIAPGIDPAQANSSSATMFYILNQLHAGSGSPPLTLQIRPDGSLSVGSNGVGTVPYRPIVAQYVADQWYDIDLHFVMSNDPSVGGVEAWLNGQQVVPWTPGRTMGDADSYLKIGQYRNKRSFTGVVYFDDVRLTRG